MMDERRYFSALGCMLVIETIIIISVALCCQDSKIKSRNKGIEAAGVNFKIITIDSCEYLIGTTGNHSYMAHKGNCRFCSRRIKLNKQ